MLKVSYGAILLIAFMTTSFADIVQCPGGTQYVQVGAPMDQVFAACGQPKQIIKSVLEPPKQEIWSYTASGMFGGVNASGFQLSFENGILNNIMIQPIGMVTTYPQLPNQVNSLQQQNQPGTTNPQPTQQPGQPQGPSVTYLTCPSVNHGSITLGMSQDQVKQNCGDPSSVQQIKTDNSQNAPKTEVVQFIYQAQPYLQPTTLTFKDGKLMGNNNP